MQFLLIFFKGGDPHPGWEDPRDRTKSLDKVPGLPEAGRWKRNRQGQTRREV